MNLLAKYAPRKLADVAGQTAAVAQLKSFASAPYVNAFIFHGPTGVGKTCAAKALAIELGCDDEFAEMGGIHEIPSGKQDGKAVDELMRSLRLRPFYGSGWKIALINEADVMTSQAEAIWLDALEHLPAKTVVVFTTNRIQSLSTRLVGRCEVVEFDGQSPDFLAGVAERVRLIWKSETGRETGPLPAMLGRYDAESTNCSLRLAVQQITPLIRTAAASAAEVKVPMGRAPAEKRKTATPATIEKTSCSEDERRRIRKEKQAIRARRSYEKRKRGHLAAMV